jgi:hypothetical protein
VSKNSAGTSGKFKSYKKNGRQQVSPLAASTHGALVGLELCGNKSREEDVRSTVTDSISLYNPEQKNNYRKLQLQEYMKNN